MEYIVGLIQGDTLRALDCGVQDGKVLSGRRTDYCGTSVSQALTSVMVVLGIFYADCFKQSFRIRTSTHKCATSGFGSRSGCPKAAGTSPFGPTTVIGRRPSLGAIGPSRERVCG